jgi:hypothetical protein
MKLTTNTKDFIKDKEREKELHDKKMSSILNGVYSSDYGKDFLTFLMDYCAYWTPTAVLVNKGFKMEEIVAYNNVVKNCIFRYLSAENTANLIKKTKGEN